MHQKDAMEYYEKLSCVFYSGQKHSMGHRVCKNVKIR